MISKELDIVLDKFKKELLTATQHVLIKQGVDEDSELVKSLTYVYDGDFFKLIAYDYYFWVSKGRKIGAKKVPVEDLIAWIKDKGIITTNINSTAFAIQRAIYKNGIKAKNYEDSVVDVSIELISEEIAEQLSEIIVDDIVDAIEN